MRLLSRSDGERNNASWLSAYCCWRTLNWEVMWAIGEIYNKKSTGPRTKPWGAPQVDERIDDVKEPVHSEAEPITPKLLERCLRREGWSMVSKAALSSWERSTSHKIVVSSMIDRVRDLQEMSQLSGDAYMPIVMDWSLVNYWCEAEGESRISVQES